MTQARRDISRKLRILNYAKEVGNISQACRHFGISREIFYRWERAYEKDGGQALINSKPCPQNPKLRTKPEIGEKILHLRRSHHFGGAAGRLVPRALPRHHHLGWRRPAGPQAPRDEPAPAQACASARRPSSATRSRCPATRVQVDVKSLDLDAPDGRKARRLQYTAIDDATRIRALKIYERHTQENAIAFVDYVIDKFPFHTHTIRTDPGHGFQVKFHRHVLDLGMEHVYIKPRTPRLNGKIERSHGTDQQEFYQLLSYSGDVDLHAKLKEWEMFYNCYRPHASLKGQTPYEVLRQRLQSQPSSTEVIPRTA